MKKYIAILILAVLAVACVKPTDPEKLVLTSESSLSIPRDGGYKSISFESGSNWFVEYEAEWLDCPVITGPAGTISFSVGAEANTTGSERSTIVKVQLIGYDKKFEVFVSQPSI
ncbi:MAG: BACON domain-containing protein [Bacteroidales bacterium]|nr:BACON domain-containing protein [Bacteroidales bacterium]